MSGVSLRRATPDDADIVHDWRSAPSTYRFQPMLPLTLDGVRLLLAERSTPRIAPDASGKFQFIIEARDGPVGWVTIEIDVPARRHHTGVIGYTIGEAHRGKGYGSAGLVALLPIAFGEAALNLERLEAVAAVENITSCRVLERAGFQREGVLRGLLIIGGVRVDHAIYGQLRTDRKRG